MPLCGEDKRKYINRLNRIEGQINGLKKLVEKDAPCMSVLKQTAAAYGAVRSFGSEVLNEHLKGCVSDAMKNKENNEELIEEVMKIFDKFTK